MGSLDVARTRTEFGLDSGSLCACVCVCVFFSLAWRFVLVCFAYFEGVDLHAHVHCCFMLWLCVWAYMGAHNNSHNKSHSEDDSDCEIRSMK